MGMFNESIYDKVVKRSYQKKYDYITKLVDFDLNEYNNNTYKDEELIVDIVNKFIDNNIDFTVHNNYIYNMYKDICIGNSNEEKNIFKSFIDLYIENNNLFINYDNFEKCISAFDNKLVALELFRNITRNDNIKDNENIENLGVLFDYVIRARSYYIDDRTLLAATLSLIDEIDPVLIKFGEKETLQEIINKRLKEDKKREGIYDIDRDTLSEIDNKIEDIYDTKNSLNTLLSLADTQIKELRLELKNNKDELTSTRIREITNLKNEANKLLKELNVKIKEIENRERENVFNEKDIFVSEINDAKEKAISEIEAVAGTIGTRVGNEINRVSNVTNESIKRLEKIGINEEMIEKVANNIAINKTPAIEVPSNNIYTPSQTIITPNTDVITEPKDKINYYFNEEIPFKKRLNELLALKRMDINENNTIYHEKFDDVLKLIMEGQTPYLYGPSGCGKTYMIEKQLAHLLGLDVISNGYVQYEQDIIGYTNSSTGEYVPSNFYRAYKFGKVIFFDELDNGIAASTVVLNRFISGHNNNYTFPNGTPIQRHPNFRIIAAGNTKGNGRTYANNTRQKMDESVLQRLVPVEIDYDNRIEKNILKDYNDWYTFAEEFRKAIEKQDMGLTEEINTVGTFTTRDAVTIKKYLDDGCFNDKEIMDYMIVSTKDLEYLEKLKLELEKQIPNTKLFNIFKNVVNERSEKIKCKQI